MTDLSSTFSKPGVRQAPEVQDIIRQAHWELGLDGEHSWNLLASRRKLEKVFFEVEESGLSSRRRIIGKVSKSERATGAYGKLKILWDAGMRPPSRYCVAEPIAWLPQLSLLLQGEAPGTQLSTKLKEGSASEYDAQLAAEWLEQLQSLQVKDIFGGTPGDVERCFRELPKALPDVRDRVIGICETLQPKLKWEHPLVPSHGDYHPMNLFIEGDCITAIDLDTLAAREPMYDVAYMFAQAAIQGFLFSGNFTTTEPFRRAFLARCEKCLHRYCPERIGVHAAFAFVRSLHYDFCILRINPTQLVEPFLSAAERCVSSGPSKLAA